VTSATYGSFLIFAVVLVLVPGRDFAVVTKNTLAGCCLRGWSSAIDVFGGASLFAFCAAVAVPDAERSSLDASITDFGNAIWRAIITPWPRAPRRGHGDEHHELPVLY
jgi:hypothetical protein